jgi:rhodanese-related sulfurtransferase
VTGIAAEDAEHRERALRLAHFRSRLAAECQLMDVVRQVESGRQEFVLLDVRDHQAFRDGHIPGAVSLPLDELAARCGELRHDRAYVAYCWRATCHLAPRAALRLTELGFDVREMNAGWREWLDGGYRVAAGPDE